MLGAPPRTSPNEPISLRYNQPWLVISLWSIKSDVRPSPSRPTSRRVTHSEPRHNLSGTCGYPSGRLPSSGVILRSCAAWSWSKSQTCPKPPPSAL